MRTIIITGAGSGIGHAVAHLLRERDNQVVGVDLRNADVIADLSVQAERDSAVKRIRSAHSEIDAVITCAGVAPPVPGNIILAVNYFGATRLLEAMLPLLCRGNQPRAVVVCSIATLLPTDPALVACCLDDREAAVHEMTAINGALAYASSKLALTRWVRRMAPTREWAGSAVLLNGISPGTIRTPMANGILATPEGRESLAKAIPIAVQDYARPEEIAPLIAFLASAENRFMVGQVPFVDGGTDALLRGEVVN